MSDKDSKKPSYIPPVMIVSRTLVLNDKNELLFLKRKIKEDYNPGMWELPGGKVNPGDTAENATDREVLEESGLVVVPLTKLCSIYSKRVVEGRYKGIGYLEITKIGKLIGGKVKIDKTDHVTHRWVSFDEAFNLKISPECRVALASLTPELTRLGII
jgi:8-oxo-dGTP pyrophosphatase MutT (NUDIX family)